MGLEWSLHVDLSMPAPGITGSLMVPDATPTGPTMARTRPRTEARAKLAGLLLIGMPASTSSAAISGGAGSAAAPARAGDRAEPIPRRSRGSTDPATGRTG